MINLAWIIGAAILGFLVAWLIRGTKLQSGQMELESATTSLAALEQENEAQQTNINKLNAKHSQLTKDHNNLKKTITDREDTVKELEEQVRLANDRPAPTVQKTITVDNSYQIKSLESKITSLERNITFKEQEIEKLNEENENLATRLDVADAGVEEAQEEKEKALAELKQYEAYRPRFEEANLERNSIKYKYEQLLASNSSSSEVAAQLQQEKASLESEVAKLKASLDQTFQQRNELQSQLTDVTAQQQKNGRTYDHLQLKYDTLLRLQERTEAKLKELGVDIL